MVQFLHILGHVKLFVRNSLDIGTAVQQASASWALSDAGCVDLCLPSYVSVCFVFSSNHDDVISLRTAATTLALLLEVK